MIPTDSVLAHLRANRERIFARLVEFASIPSVSTDPAHAADVDRAAAWVAAELAAAGPIVVRMLPTAGNPTVFFSFSTADEGFHAPNEFFRVHRLHEGVEAWARYWEMLGKERG